MSANKMKNLIVLYIILSPFLITPFCQAGSRAYLETVIDDNSSYLQYYGHKVGVVSHTVRRTTPVTYPTNHEFRYGCASSIGETWYDDPITGIYTTGFDRQTVRFKVTKVDIYDQYNQKTSGSVYDVDFEDMKAWAQTEEEKKRITSVTYYSRYSMDITRYSDWNDIPRDRRICR